MTTRHLRWLVIPLFAFVVTTRAQVLLDEKFSYADGQLTNLSSGANVSLGNWTTLSGTGTPLQVLAGQIAGLVHGSGSREDATRVFSGADVTTSALFASFSFTVNTAPTTAADYFFAFNSLSSSNFLGRTFLSAPTTSGFRLGISNNSSTVAYSQDLVTGVTYFAVVRVDTQGLSTSALWVGTDLAGFGSGSPNVLATDAIPTLAAGRVTLRQGSSITAANAVNLDNLKVGVTFADVTAIPEPSAYAMALGGLTLAAVVWTKRRGCVLK